MGSLLINLLVWKSENRMDGWVKGCSGIREERSWNSWENRGRKANEGVCNILF